MGGMRAVGGCGFEPLPGPFSHRIIAGRDRQRRLGNRHALGQRDRPADDHEKIVGVWPLVAHDKLEMDAKELPAEQVVMLALDHFPPPPPPYPPLPPST